MALGSWQGLYNAVILDLMSQQRERELLLLMAISSHADQFGFCFPGRARQATLRHCAKSTQLKDEMWLQANRLIVVEEVPDLMRRQTRPFYQVSPRAIYIREELQEYCEAVFDGIRYRDFAWEKKLDLILRSTKDSQPESLTRSTTRISNQTQNPNTEPNTEPADDAKTQKGRNAPTMRSAAPKLEQSEAPKSQRRKAQPRKTNPQAGGGDEFDALLSPTVDDDRIVLEIVHVVSTTKYQAQDAVATYPRDAIVHWLRRTAQRRARGTLSKPGGWFFTNLQKQTPLPEQHWPAEWIAQRLINDETSDPNSHDMEV